MADDRSKAPRPKIVTEQTQGEAPQQATPHLQAASAPRDTSSDPVSHAPRDTSSDPVSHDAAQHGSFRQGVDAARSWVSRTFPGNENAFLGGVLGFLVAILIFAIGFWRTLFVIVLVTVGVCVGQQMDGDPKLWNAVRKLFSSRDR